MKSSIFKSWFIALLLLAFTSQSMAALTMVCEMPQQLSQLDMHASHTRADMHHANMSHPMAETGSAEHSKLSRNLPDAHCATMDHCTSGSCLLPALSSSFSVDTMGVTATVMDSYDSGVPVALVSSLYRPPIFR